MKSSFRPGHIVLLMLLCFLSVSTATADRAAGFYNQRGKKCRALASSDLGEYFTRRNLKCVRTRSRAQSMGFEDADTGVLASAGKGEIFVFDLAGENAVPPAATDKSGSCTAVLNDAEDNLRVVCAHSATTATMAHIHLGPAGEKGPKICVASSPLSPVGFDCAVDSSLVNALRNKELYINLHSSDFPTGELRNQIQ